MRKRWLGREIYIDVRLIVALCAAGALALGMVAWVRLWPLFGDSLLLAGVGLAFGASVIAGVMSSETLA